MVYNFDGIDGIPDDQLQLQISDQLFFEVILLEIRGKTILYASYRKKFNSQMEMDLEQKNKRVEENIIDENLEELENLKVQLQELRDICHRAACDEPGRKCGWRVNELGQ